MWTTFFKNHWVNHADIFFNHRLFQMLRSAPSLIVFSILIIIFEYAIPDFISNYISVFDQKNMMEYSIYYLIFTYLCFFIMPFLLNQCIYREKLKNLGLAFSQKKWSTGFLMILALAFLLPFLGYFSTRPEFQAFLCG